MNNAVDYIRILGSAEFDHRAPEWLVHTPKSDVMLTPLGGAVLVRLGSMTAQTLQRWSTSSIDGNACLQPEALPTVHPGLKSEVLYSVGMHAEAQLLLESSKRARDYALALVGVQHYGAWRAAEFREFQTLARSINAAEACFDILAELGIGPAR